MQHSRKELSQTLPDMLSRGDVKAFDPEFIFAPFSLFEMWDTEPEQWGQVRRQRFRNVERASHGYVVKMICAVELA